MKEKIIAAIKAKFPAINLSKKRLNEIAAFIEKKVIDDETKVDAALDSYNDFNPIADIAKQDDTIRNLEAKLKAAQPPKKEEVKEDPPIEVTDDTPAWAKALIEQNKKLNEGLTALQGEKIKTTIHGKITDKLNEKGKEVPASFWGKRIIPDKEEEIEAFVTEVQTDWSGLVKESTEKGLSMLSAPKSSAAPPVDSKVVSPEIKAFVEKQAAMNKNGAEVNNSLK